MLIGGVSEVEGREGEADARDSTEYQTADELFELLAKENSFNINDDHSLSTGDLVILYKNIDVGTKLMNNINNLHCKPPNQHVETVIYKDDRESEDSDISEIYSNEDFQDVFLINSERIDLINNMSSIQHTLEHKCGDIDIKPSNLTTNYNRQFLFKDPYLKQQLKNLNIMADTKEFDTILPASLLDYICCKRLEDNYNFYMDNIIRYVQHTIEQLKRISNGDYLTDRAREKWREVEKDYKKPRQDVIKVLATSVSIPLNVEGKVNGYKSTWDDIVHSELDIRSLSKILEKKIVIEIPKLICGSYKLFSEHRDDNLIIRCKKDSNADTTSDKEDKARVDVVLQLKRSESGHVISNINSIMILQKVPSIAELETGGDHCKQIEFMTNSEFKENRVKIVEIDEQSYNEERRQDTVDTAIGAMIKPESQLLKEIEHGNLDIKNYHSLSQSSVVYNETLTKKVAMKTETNYYTLMNPGDLSCTIQRLNMQAPVPEECEEGTLTKKKSPLRVRMKSPYENKSFFMEEKKRKKLIEIRERRERKKMALNEHSKISKHKYGKGAVMAQPSSSVTKLSITNKSFYNSIYGENSNHESLISKKVRKGQKKDGGKNECENDFRRSSYTAVAKCSFEDLSTETEMQLQQNMNTENSSTSDTPKSNYGTNVNLLSQLMISSGTDYDSVSDDDSSPLLNIDRDIRTFEEIEHIGHETKGLEIAPSSCNLVPENSRNLNLLDSKFEDEAKNTPSPNECRKSIDKVYNLIKKLGKVDEMTESSKHNIDKVEGEGSSTVQISDSGTSVKHHLISSNPSSFTIDKNIKTGINSQNNKTKRDLLASVVPKVVISTKLQTSKADDRNRINRKRNVKSPPIKIADNPLKAISQLLHDFDNVQKTRNKSHRKTDLDDVKPTSRQGSSKNPRQEQQPRQDAGATSLRFNSSKEKKSRAEQSMNATQITYHVIKTDDKYTTRIPRRNMSDIIDEAKEARGEAVRGPSRFYSRLDTLAQPKKPYIHAHHDDLQSKTVRSTITPRLQRSTISKPIVEKNMTASNGKNKRRVPETSSVPSAKAGFSTVPPIERIIKPRRSASNSPARKRILHPINEQSGRQNIGPETPENLKKKMVAVESYVKSHYGYIDSNQVGGHEIHKSRVPLIPNDIELASMTSSPTAEESTALGKKLHVMINTMINTNAPRLSVLTETTESKSNLNNVNLGQLKTESLLEIKEHKSESDYPVDIFEDKNIETAVASISRGKILEDKVTDESIGTVETVNGKVQSCNSATELRKLENALYHKMSVGAFPKRLRIKNLTLTPKQSLQEVIVVQSGDAGSVLVKSSLSQNLRISRSKTDSLSALKPLAALSNTLINFGSTDIPMQVATIGYVFPTYKSQTSLKPSRSKILDQTKNCSSNGSVVKNNYKSHKTSQCFKGINMVICTEQSTQADIVMSKPSTHKIDSELIERKQIDKQTESESPKKTKCDKNEEVEFYPKNSQCNDINNVSEGTGCISPESIGHRTSLDILMGLLNEIRKITGEVVNRNIDDEDDINQSKELEIILNNAAARESSVDNICKDLVSIRSLDKLKASEPSVSSIKLQQFNQVRLKNHDNEGYTKNACISHEKVLNMDKEVNADLEKQYVNRLTDVPSCFLSVTIDQSTNVTDTTISVISGSSTQSVYTVAEYETIYCNSSYYDNVTEFSRMEASDIIYNFVQNVNTSDRLNSSHLLKKETTADMVILENPNERGSDKRTEISTHNEPAEMKIVSKTSKAVRKLTKRNGLTSKSDFDSLMKMKRDILVTVYSILVFTVFAALSFPKVFFTVDI